MQKITRGRILKGKSKTLLKTIISALALLMASVGLFNLFSRKEQVYAAVTIASEEYTSKDTNNIIMSVEKVAVAKDYTSKITDDEIKSFLAPNNKTYYYADIANGDKSKTVVENNKYIMLNNNATENNHYYNSYITDIREGQTIIKMSEAIMFTFGTYVYEKDDLGEHVYRNSEGKSSQLQHLNLEVYKGGHRGDAGAEKMPSEDFSTRQYQIGDKSYHDFVYILEQADVGESTKYTEGYYEFFVEYQLFGGDTETQTFGFYLIYESSYTNVYTPAGKSYFYTARPTLSVYGGGLTSDGSNVNHFRLGDSTNYPTLIYDYTKYVVGYTYTANGKRSTYNYTYTTKQNMGYTENHLICDVTSSGEKLEPVDYLLKSDNNMAVIMLTEVGTYNFTFSYIYTGDLKDEAPDITESLKIDGTSLQIHGFESKYSKDGYNEAQLRYVTLSTDENDNIDLVVPNGYVKDSTPLTEDLQIVYSTNSSSSARVGNVIAQEDALVNTQITKNVAQTLDDTTLKTLDDVVAGLKSDDATTFNTAKAEVCLDKIDYVKTNQNSVWFSTNDAFDDESYYFYDRTDPNNFTSGNGRKEYGNTVSFVNPGYYLVLIKVKLGYVADGGAVQDYYQVFAFEITSKTIVAKLTKESTGEAIGSGKYTNDNVIVTWEEPATFERQISARYYTNTQPTPVIIANGKVLGEEVKTGDYSKYTIEIKSEGEASTTHTVTIDRQPISNVGLYEIETISADTSRFYMVRQTEGGGYAKVSGLISDSAVTLYWNNKLSGAGITAKYWRWDFTENKSADVFNIYGSAESTESWFSNKYQLSSAEPGVISGISKANSLDSEVAPAYVYRENGVYLFELTDDAGNSCYYMFVVDSTPAYLKVGNEFVNAQAKLFTTGVDVEASTHKAIKMFDETELEETASQLVERIKNSTSGKEILSSFIKLASFSTNQTENFKKAGFFYTNQSDATEIERMQKLFSRQQNNAYLVVKNMYMYAYDSEQHEDTSLYMNIQTASSRIKHINEVANGHSTSTVRNLYIVGENQLHVGQT
ncbi:MAG: hypothetical protein MJ152_00720, partial [Clostridia bacterium]|nr:hypothetical protein [Clostridia bacterium]